ncbi:restriction endonuclease subunit S [Dialister sp.]|jgi:restriction endonuclease S subunit|uniref:restriction endonuclease subunit S n=1 Tax=Dialister sp. TaxID=1955814 RepID=UPI003A5BB609
MIDTQALRQKVIDSAITGHLTTQNNTENAKDELQKIIASLGKPQQRRIELGEKWNSIPNNWAWTTLESITTTDTLNDGNWVLKKDMVDDGPVKLLQLGCIGDCKFITKKYKYLTDKKFDELGGKQIYPGYLLINRLVIDKMKSCIIPNIDGKLITAVDVCWVAPNEEFYNLDYVLYALNSSGFQRRVQNLGRGVTRFRISKLNLINIAFPFPPREEQNRIVNEISNAFILLDKIDDLQSRYANNLSALDKKILDLAVQGKLVPQDPSDEPASVLLEKIAAEKQKLIQEGKIKKQKKLPAITEDEIPFKIPESWEWARIGVVFNLQAGKNKKASQIFSKKTDIHKYPCFGGNGIRGYVDDYNRCGEYALIGRQGALCGNINFAEGKFYATEHAVVVEHFANTNVTWSGYFLRALNLNQYATATAQPGLAVSNINNVLIPIPPVNEQKRIVKMIDKINAQIDLQKQE